MGVGDKVHEKGAGVGGQEPGDEGESAGGEGHGLPDPGRGEPVHEPGVTQGWLAVER